MHTSQAVTICYCILHIMFLKSGCKILWASGNASDCELFSCESGQTTIHFVVAAAIACTCNYIIIIIVSLFLIFRFTRSYRKFIIFNRITTSSIASQSSVNICWVIVWLPRTICTASLRRWNHESSDPNLTRIRVSLQRAHRRDSLSQLVVVARLAHQIWTGCK